MTATYSCLLKAWHRTCTGGHCLNPTQFIVLCGVLQHPSEPISASQRAKRLHFSFPTITHALRSLADLHLATLIQKKGPGNPALTAQPTPAAYQLFGLKGPRQRPTA